MSGYFNFEFNPKQAVSLKHIFNRPYSGAKKFDLQAPDAAGTLSVWARDEQEAKDHLMNALWDIVFERNRCGAAVENPACIFCGHQTESRGRNSSGTRQWRCLSVECHRSFVINRTFKGGINHPQSSKRPDFYRLVFVEGKTLPEAQEILGISQGAASRWYKKAAEANGITEPLCPCGKPLRHHGQCMHRIKIARLRARKIFRADLNEAHKEMESAAQ